MIMEAMANKLRVSIKEKKTSPILVVDNND